jgi:hypothetical protein
MTKLPCKDDANMGHLISKGLVEKRRVANRTYYSLAWEVTDILGKNLPNAGDNGDIGEKTPHRVGSYLTAQHVEKNSDANAERYYRQSGDTVFDVVGLSRNGSISVVCEVETKSNNRETILDDYDKMAAVDAPAYWIVDSFQTAREIISTIQERRGELEEINTYDQSYSDLRTDLKDASTADGLHQIYSIQEIRDLV